ncbi:TetR/AcrR family transcriptional regulator [Allosphingosinicella deserti]|uniref:TetR/AcrR family transcriptional regulator n=1 Tax=Allosphingosinicella deserti TaxID=2116704 RepID=UPI0018EC5676|nr:TetR/AcrR family transcriptional regulator [Sphingomonas deserti]
MTRDTAPPGPPASPNPRQRLTRSDRAVQLLSVAWEIVRTEGTGALTLGYLAARAGVTKPVVYDHFGDRNGLLAALYLGFDQRQNEKIDRAIAASAPTAEARAEVLARAYVDCVLTEGREIGDLVAALSGTPELQTIRRDRAAPFMEKFRAALAPASPSGDVGVAGLHAFLGAAEALSQAAAGDEISPEQAKHELRDLILDMLARQVQGRATVR